MDKNYIEENEIEIKYLRNQLTPEELDGFEVYLMENPDMVEQLELHQAFLENLPKAELVKPGESNLIMRLLGGLLNTPRQLVAGFSAGAVVSMLLASTVFFNSGHLELSQVGTLSQLRNSDDPFKGRTILEFPEDSFGYFSNEVFVLTVPVNMEAGVLYNATIYTKDSENEKLSIDVDQLQADEFGSLYLALKVRGYTPGIYLVEISPKSLDYAVLGVDKFVFETKVKK